MSKTLYRHFKSQTILDNMIVQIITTIEYFGDIYTVAVNEMYSARFFEITYF